MAETISVEDPRLDKICQQIVRYANAQFDSELQLSGTGDAIDSIILGLNVLGEELQSYIVRIRAKEKQLTEAIFLLNEAQHLARLGSWDLDIPQNTISWSDEMYKLLGLEKANFEITYENYLNFVHPDDRDYVNNAIQRALANKESFQLDHRIINTQGKIRWHHSRGEVFTDHDGNPVKMTGTAQDVTEKRNTEIQAQRMAAIVESTSDAIISKTLGGIITSWNRQAEKIFGYKKEEVIGKHISILFPAERLPEEQEIVDSIKKGKSLINYETERKRKDGSLFPVAITVSPIMDEQSNIIGISKIARDITEKKNIEEQLNKYTRELEYRSQEAHEFSYIASHDLQEPLRTITNYITLFAKDYKGKLDENADIYINFIKNAAGRMRHLITDLLEYNKIEKEREIVNIDLNQVVAEILHDMQSQIAENKAQIHVGDLPIIKGYPVRLRSLFQNLIGNAIKFRKRDVEPIVEVTSRDTGKEWLFEITDNGIGIDKAYFPKIFKLFQRLHTRQEYEGTGIGLAHCKKIVELRGGRLWVESEPGTGSSFFFTLPKQIKG